MAPSGFPAGGHVYDRVRRRRLRQLLWGRHPMGARDRDRERLRRQQRLSPRRIHHARGDRRHAGELRQADGREEPHERRREAWAVPRRQHG